MSFFNSSRLKIILACIFMPIAGITMLCLAYVRLSPPTVPSLYSSTSVLAMVTQVGDCTTQEHYSKGRTTTTTTCLIDYQYDYMDQTYPMSGSINHTPKVGESFKIIVDKSDPSIHIQAEELSHSITIFIIGFIFLVVSAIFIRSIYVDNKPVPTPSRSSRRF